MQRVYLDRNVTKILVDLVVDLMARYLTMGADQPIGFAGEFKVDAPIRSVKFNLLSTPRRLQTGALG